MIAEHLSVEEVAGIKEGFLLMDTSKRGKINADELRTGLHKLGHQIPDADLQILMEAVSNTRVFVALDLLILIQTQYETFMYSLNMKPITFNAPFKEPNKHNMKHITVDHRSQ